MHDTLSSRRCRLLIVNTYKNRHFLTLVRVLSLHLGSALWIGWYRAKKDPKHASSIWISCGGYFLNRIISLRVLPGERTSPPPYLRATLAVVGQTPHPLLPRPRAVRAHPRGAD